MKCQNSHIRIWAGGPTARPDTCECGAVRYEAHQCSCGNEHEREVPVEQRVLPIAMNGKIWDIASDIVGKVIVPCLLLLVLPVLVYAQTPTLVSDCIKGGYDECRLVAGHWYTRMGSEWKDEDGKAIKEPPLIPAMDCPADTSKLYQQMLRDLDYKGPWPVVDKPSRFDWSFVKDPRFYIGTGFSFAVTSYDIGTSHGLERTRFYRNDQGMLNKGKYIGITALSNAALLPLDMARDHRWRWASLGLRVTLGIVRLNAAVHNQVKR